MKLSQELFEKTYRNYIQQYPSHEEFFRRVIKQDGPINRIWLYTYLPAEELDLRTKFKEEIKERDYQELHQRMIREKGQELTDLHNDFIIVEKADRIHLNPDPLKMIYHEVPLTIAGIRKLLRRVEERTYREGEKNISERKEYQYLPWWIYITREISNGKTKVEVEIEFLRKPNFEEQVHYWESFSITEILQRFKDMSEIVGTVWNINPDVDYSIILSHGGKKRQFPVNLLHRERYYNLIRSALQKYRVERDKGGGRGGGNRAWRV